VLVSAGLLPESLRKLQQVDPGFRKGHVLLLTIRPDNYKGQSALSLHREILHRLAAIPGVEVVLRVSSCLASLAIPEPCLNDNNVSSAEIGSL
jgi:hypothetical protein